MFHLVNKNIICTVNSLSKLLDKCQMTEANQAASTYQLQCLVADCCTRRISLIMLWAVTFRVSTTPGSGLCCRTVWHRNLCSFRLHTSIKVNFSGFVKTFIFWEQRQIQEDVLHDIDNALKYLGHKQPEIWEDQLRSQHRNNGLNTSKHTQLSTALDGVSYPTDSELHLPAKRQPVALVGTAAAATDVTDSIVI